MSVETLHCETCDRHVDHSAATRTETYGDLDSDRWQTLCCPECGTRLETVFVGLEE
jgi:hypothetical protein